MAHAQARFPSARGSGDGEMGKPRKVALITGITGQVSAEAGARARSGAAGARVRVAPRSVLPAFPGTAFWASRKVSVAREVGDDVGCGECAQCIECFWSSPWAWERVFCMGCGPHS